MQKLHPDIQFTIERDSKKVDFLDITIIERERKIITDIHYKITDTHQYLHFDSCHPRHTKRMIPYNLARRICTIVSDKDLKEKRLDELRHLLIDRKYPKKLIEGGISRAIQQEIKELRKKKEREKSNDIIPFVHTFNPNNVNAYQLVQNTIPCILNDDIMKKVLTNSKIIASRRQAPNLKKILTKSLLSTREEGIVTKCTDRRCKTCPYMPSVKSVTFKHTNKTFILKSSFTCKSKNLIYCMTCNGCSKQYIGETGDVLRNRMTVHRQHIRDSKYQILSVSKHIAKCAKGITPEFTISPFYKMRNENDIERKNKESFFISVFKPELNAKE